jgi:peroxiredoxin
MRTIVAACLGLALLGIAHGEGVRAALKPVAARKPASAFQLPDASSKSVRLSDYRGKVVLLNFWAVNCGGCRLEIPWLIDIENAYKPKGAAVVGVSMDISYEDLKNAQEAWTRVNPFVRDHKINYDIVMADKQVEKGYDLDALPATYLIDRNGRVAATYLGLIDKDNIQANLKALLNER